MTEPPHTGPPHTGPPHAGHPDGDPAEPWDPPPDYGRMAPREPRAPDPLAVAVANASLLGAGYLLLGRRALFWAAAAVTASLLWLTYRTAETWCELLVALWWATAVGHGWWLARRHPAAAGRRAQRLLALALAVPVLAARRMGAVRRAEGPGRGRRRPRGRGLRGRLGRPGGGGVPAPAGRRAGGRPGGRGGRGVRAAGHGRGLSQRRADR
ncbi:hypothetical protein [Streptomyces sp. NPDC127039]|uniref:hypothetical protein n=1 Tax=Streptomyces sp. NPDC127039 TaxID=3347115 RepID=UPI003661612B